MPRRGKSSFDGLDADTRKGIAVVCLFFGGIFILLSIFDLGGDFGRSLSTGLSHVFGWDRLLLPFFLMAWGYHMVAPERLPIRFTNVLGMILFFLSLNPLIHAVTFPQLTNVPTLAIQAAGGKLGEVVSIPIWRMLGMAGSITIFIALFVVSLLLMFNATIHDILSVFRWIWCGLVLFLRGLSFPVKKWKDNQVRQQTGLTTKSIKAMKELEDSGESESETDENEEEGDASEAESDELAESPSDESEEEEEEVVPPKPKKKYPRIEIPIELLERRDTKPTSGDINHNRDVIRKTLDKFGIPVEMHEVAVGPTVTQFSLKPAEGIKLSKITGLHNDLALALAAHPIRIEAPIPGKSLVGIEVPNQSVATVGMREIIESREFKERKNNLNFVLGKDVAGKPWIADLTRMPHCLVAGATGSGKSVMLNAVIMSFLYSNGPDDVKFIMVDPKRVELQVYNGIPHLITPVITKVPETVNALKWALREMDRRYDLLSHFGSKDIASYNARVEDRLPYIVIVIDELADLMATSASEVEGPIVRLAQMSRAVGIHLVLATQRPSVDVITGLIKANVPGRIAFAVASSTDSRTILDQQGAEKLLGRGDMLLSTAEISVPKRIQGAFVSENEIQRVVNFIKSHYDPADYDNTVTEHKSSGTVFSGDGGSSSDEDADPMLPMAKEEIIRAGKASASLLQRRLKVGYARAARILDLLEQEGFIGPSDGAKPREILKVEFTKQMETVQRPSPIPSQDPVEEEIEEEEVDEEEK